LLARPALPWSRPPVILDVRLAPKPGETVYVIPLSLRIPLYIYIQRTNVFALARRLAFAFFAVPGTERNPEWLTDVQAAVPDKGAQIIVACTRGGKLDQKPGAMFGFSSPSLKAVHFLREAGYRNVAHLGGGLYEWERSELPLEEADA